MLENHADLHRAVQNSLGVTHANNPPFFGINLTAESGDGI
jgi:hypothetical protein